MLSNLFAKVSVAILVPVLLYGSAALRAAEGRTPLQWLERMSEAVERRNYIATFVYSNGSELQSIRVVHRHDHTGVRERMISLTGPPREVLRNGAEVTCIFPDDRSVLVSGDKKSSGARSSLFQLSPDLKDNYRLTTHLGERVAGRTTQTVLVQPRDVYRYGYRLALDLDSALPLRSELLGSSGRALERIVYTNIQVGPQIEDEQLRSTTVAENFTWRRADDAPEQAGIDSGWTLTWLPPGFRAVRQLILGDDASVSRHHLTYSDGVASFSVFIEPLNDSQKGMRGMSQMGPTSAFGRVIGSTQITVIGEVPEKTVRHVGESISRNH